MNNLPPTFVRRYILIYEDYSIARGQCGKLAKFLLSNTILKAIHFFRTVYNLNFIRSTRHNGAAYMNLYTSNSLNYILFIII